MDTPEPIVDRIGKALETALARPEVRETRYRRLRAAQRPTRSVRRHHQVRRRAVGQVVKDAGIPPD